jgi:lipopolysaccharide biosynthesis regulator YciM
MLRIESAHIILLALIVAAVVGWCVGRWLNRKPPADSFRHVGALREQYFQGLHFVLNEEPDKALEVFLRMVEVDNETVETHFALGSLYRRRGEVERAIRVHENILARQTLKPEHGEHAMFALAEDYFRAGLFDRAERSFQLIAAAVGSRRSSALRNLLSLYEQQRDWPQAIATYQRLEVLASPEHPTAIAHYHCELAEAARQGGDLEGARAQLRQAREHQRNFARGALIRADIALDMNDPALAADLCRRVAELHPQLLPLVLRRFAEAAEQSGISGKERAFEALARSEPTARAEFAYAAIVAGLENEPFILDYVRDFIREDPNLSDLVPALAGDAAQLDEERLKALSRALARIFRRTQRYRCVECGFASATHFWQCPGCRSWDALAPVARLEIVPVPRTR